MSRYYLVYLCIIFAKIQSGKTFSKHCHHLMLMSKFLGDSILAVVMNAELELFLSLNPDLLCLLGAMKVGTEYFLIKGWLPSVQNGNSNVCWSLSFTACCGSASHSFQQFFSGEMDHRGQEFQLIGLL